MGTEQENTGLSDAEEMALYKQAFNAISKGEAFEDNVAEPVVPPEETPADEPATEPETPAAEPAATEPPKDESAPQATLPEDIVKRLKELEEERDRLKHAEASARGRAIAFQNKSEQALAELNRARAAQQQPTPPAKSKITDTEEWKLLQENDPVTARLLENFREETLRQAEEIASKNVKTAIEPFEQTFQRDAFEKAQQELYQRVPNLDEVKASEAYQNWWNLQDESVQNLGYKPSGVVRIMQLYAADMATYGAKPEAPAAPTAPVKEVIVPAVVNDIQKERERKLQGQGVTTKTTTPPSELSDEALFRKTYKDNLRKTK